MTRPLRLEYPGALYHVLARGNDRRDVFRDDADRQFYLSRLAYYRERLGFRVYAYCLMSNHLHLAVEAGNKPLSRLMRALQGTYTQAFNRRHRRSGHLFQGRYKALLVQKDPYLLALIRYIHRNPVRARIVGRCEDYEWSSDRWYRGGGGPTWLETDFVLSMFASTRRAAIEAYREFTDGNNGVRYEALRTFGQIVKGNEEFAERTLQASGEPELVRRSLRVERVAKAVAAVLGVDMAVPRSPRRVHDLSNARAVVGYVAWTIGGIPLSRTARYLGRDRSTLVRDRQRLEDRLKVDRRLRDQVADITERVTNTSNQQ